MKWSNFISDSIFELPIKQKDSNDYYQTIDVLLDEFLLRIQQIESYTIPATNITHDQICEVQTTLIKGIKDAVSSYMNGKPFDANTKIIKVLKQKNKNFYDLKKGINKLNNE